MNFERPGAGADRSPTPALARHLAATKFDDIPAAAIEATKRRLLDLIGCAFGGARAELTDTLPEVLGRSNGDRCASLLFGSGKMVAADAAMANAIAARSYDYEVMATAVAGKVIPSHTSPTTVMAALAMAEREDTSGAELLAAMTLGDDLVARILGSAGFDFDDGWDASSIHSGLGAAAICARLLQLGERGITDALGMAVNMVGGTVQSPWDGSSEFKLGQGMAARHGLLCADLAKAGWTGMDDPLFAPNGFYHQFSPGCVHPEILTVDLGNVYFAEEYFKPYPACAAAHTAIECAIGLRQNPAVRPERIERLTLRLPEPLLPGFCAKPYQPRRFAHCDAIFSYRFQVANVLINGPTRQEHYADGKLRDPALAALAGRIDLALLDASVVGFGADGPCEIEAKLLDGTTCIHRLDRLSRYPTVRQSTDGEVRDKFLQQCEFSGRVDHQVALQVMETVAKLETHPSMREFLRLLATRQIA